MLLLLLSGLWMLLVPLSFGSWLLGQIRRWSPPQVSTEAPISIVVVWWLGLALLTAFLETWALFGPLRDFTFIAVAVLTVAFPLLDRPSWQQIMQSIRWEVVHGRPLAWVVVVVLGVALLILTTLPPTSGDTGNYHAPFVRWLEEMGAVPGLANLDLHLGYNSSWLATQVVSSWAQWVGSPLQVLTPLALLLFAGYALAPLNSKQIGPISGKAIFRLLLGGVLLFWCSDRVPSLGTDAPTAVLAFLVLSQAVELGIPGRGRPLTLGHLAIVLLVFYSITIKFSAAPLALLPLVWLWQCPGAGRAKVSLLIRLLGFGLVLVLPWVLNTVVLTGYLLFPFPSLDVLAVDWKVPRALVYEHVAYIRNFARNQALSQYNVAGKPISYWLPVWWQQQQPYDQLITLLAPGLALLSTAILARSRFWWGGHVADWALVLSTALGGSVFWFNSAPAYRFGYPFILPLLCLLLVPLLRASSRKLRLDLRPLLAFSMVGALLGALVLVELRSFGVPRLLTPAEFTDVLTRVPDGDSRTLVAACYQPDSSGFYVLRTFLPSGTKFGLVRTLVRYGQLQADGVTATGQRWLRPASYPNNVVERFRIGQVIFKRPPARVAPHVLYRFWYAPFPATDNPSICLRTGCLRDGFLSCQQPLKDD